MINVDVLDKYFSFISLFAIKYVVKKTYLSCDIN